jgi:hypothetical protein
MTIFYSLRFETPQGGSVISPGTGFLFVVSYDWLEVFDPASTRDSTRVE